MNLSIVIPAYNSATILPVLFERLERVLVRVNGEYEIIFVNDGSQDNSWEVIRQLAGKSPRVRGIRLMRNYGQHNALLAGIRAAQYEVVVTMDDDLQHPPEEIPALLTELEKGYDVVYGIPKRFPHSAWRNFFSKTTKLIMAKIMGVHRIQDISAFRALRTNLRQAFGDYQSPDILLDVLLSWGTTKFSAVNVNHYPRTIGKSNYRFSRLVNQALLILTGFSTLPIRFATLAGFATIFLGLVLLIYVLGKYFLEGSIPGFSFIASMIIIFSGVQLFSLGVFGEYLARIFNRTMERPIYVVRESINLAEDTK